MKISNTPARHYDYIPIVSTFTNLSAIAQKCLSTSQPDKSFARCLVGLVPIVGNFTLALSDNGCWTMDASTDKLPPPQEPFSNEIPAPLQSPLTTTEPTRTQEATYTSPRIIPWVEAKSEPSSTRAEVILGAAAKSVPSRTLNSQVSDQPEDLLSIAIDDEDIASAMDKKQSDTSEKTFVPYLPDAYLLTSEEILTLEIPLGFPETL